MSDRDRVAQAICRTDARIKAESRADGVVIDNYEDEAEYYLALADAAIEAMEEPTGLAFTDTSGDYPPLPRNYEDVKVKVTPASTKRGTRLPEDWQPSDRVKAELVHRYPHLNFPLLLDEFRDYWCAVPGQRGLKLSWDRTFRNRVRECAHKRQYWKRQPGQLSKVDSKAAEYLK